MVSDGYQITHDAGLLVPAEGAGRRPGAALLLRDATGAEVVRITNDEMFRMIRMGSPQYVLKIGPAQVHYHRSWCRHINFPLAPRLKAAFASLSLQALFDEAEKTSLVSEV